MDKLIWMAVALLSILCARASAQAQVTKLNLADTPIASANDAYMGELSNAAALLESHGIHPWVLGSHGVTGILVPQDDSIEAVRLLEKAKRVDGLLFHVRVKLRKHPPKNR
ncbi:MAG: hypothetical protein ACHQ50_08375 [Fimbriimonadales bacterium]